MLRIREIGSTGVGFDRMLRIAAKVSTSPYSPQHLPSQLRSDPSALPVFSRSHASCSPKIAAFVSNAIAPSGAEAIASESSVGVGVGVGGLPLCALRAVALPRDGFFSLSHRALERTLCFFERLRTNAISRSNLFCVIQFPSHLQNSMMSGRNCSFVSSMLREKRRASHSSSFGTRQSGERQMSMSRRRYRPCSASVRCAVSAR